MQKVFLVILLLSVFTVPFASAAEGMNEATASLTGGLYHLSIGLAAIGSALGLGMAVGRAMEAMGRQPEAAGRIQTAMIIGAAFIEALTIYALISSFVRNL
jgi:F-type H+-transporting ATPase subunit c